VDSKLERNKDFVFLGKIALFLFWCNLIQDNTNMTKLLNHFQRKSFKGIYIYRKFLFVFSTGVWKRTSYFGVI